MIPFSHFNFINRRKQVLILKSLVPLALFVIIFMLIWSRSSVSRKKGVHSSKKGAIRKVSGSDFLVRKRVLKENRDEFLDIVLKEVHYHEVNLLTRQKNAMEYYDEAIAADEKIVIPGLGEDGKEAKVPKKYQASANATMKKESFNRILSELISVNRSVPDSREETCQSISYNVDNLPTMSIISIFKNEAYTSIVRMLHGIFNRTPAKVLEEIILVDDFSRNRDLLGKLERYVATRLPVEKIRIVRLHRNAGLIRARMIGAHLALGEVLVFLDAHCEVNKAWAEPLLQRVQEDKTVVACPVIDVVDEKTMEYSFLKNRSLVSMGGFKWSGHFDWIPEMEREKKRKKYHHQPTRTPTMAGGLFAMDRKYFWKMGSYDPGMKIWGGENLEMSFRIWQCGGSIEIIPCSRVGHIFRSSRPYNFTAEVKTNNIARVAHVWLDEYKDLMLTNQFFKAKRMGDVSRRKEMRRRLKCNDFQWYLDNVYPEKFKLQFDSIHYGRVKNDFTNQCLDQWGSSNSINYTLEAFNCSTDAFYTTQEHFFSTTGQLRRELTCATKEPGYNTVKMVWCEELKPKNKSFVWEYDEKSKRLVHAETKLCLTAVKEPARKIKDDDVYQPVLEDCNEKMKNHQKWEFIRGHIGEKSE